MAIQIQPILPRYVGCFLTKEAGPCVLNDQKLKEVIVYIKHYATDDLTFATRVIRLCDRPYQDVAEMLAKETYKEFSESEHAYSIRSEFKDVL